MQQHREMLTRDFGRQAGTALTVLEHLYHQPYVSVSRVREWRRQTHASANSLMAD
ncbi:hypothetical protein ACI3L1_09055 [Deinococcus sp. SM5_A1]|uniref:hypothetical protein n=1 Tax=Deinococcus sp. SM5_A1 TaxID=3379094 RepID=UPI00385DE8F7